MLACVMTDFGFTPELADVTRPEPAEGEGRVHVHAAAVNGFDTSVANPYPKGMMEHCIPVVLGKHFAGVVDGSFAEYVTVPVDVCIAALPYVNDFFEGAALGLAGAAALGLLDVAELKRGQTVLVSGPPVVSATRPSSWQPKPAHT